MLDKITNLQASIELLGRLRIVTERIDDLLKRLDPKQHKIFSEAKTKLRELNPAYTLLSEIDGGFFHGRSIIYNRATRSHRDRRDMKFAWTPLLTLGTYTSGWLRILNLDIPYLPGTLVLLRGGALHHSVTFSGGQRIALAHFMHQNVLSDVGVEKLPLTPV